MELWQKKGLQTLKDVCDHLNYNHPPELLTMYMCIFGEKHLAGRLEHVEEKVGLAEKDQSQRFQSLRCCCSPCCLDQALRVRAVSRRTDCPGVKTCAHAQPSIEDMGPSDQ